MAQHDYDLTNQNGANFRSDINNALAAIVSLNSGTSAPGTTFAYQLWVDTTNGLLKQRNAANSAWLVRGSLKETFVVSKTSGFTAGLGDHQQVFICTNTFTLALTAAATLGDGWSCCVRNDGIGVITIDPNSTEQIDGVTSIALNPGDSCTVYCNGSAFKTIGRPTSSSDTGRIVFFGSSTPPTGWLKCNGAAVSRTTYADLFAVIGTTFGTGDGSTTFNLPELRAEFPRFWDDSRGIDTGRVLGSLQSDEIKAHTHTYSLVFGGAGASAATAGVNGTSTSNTGSTGGTETRPRNIALLGIIKY